MAIVKAYSWAPTRVVMPGIIPMVWVGTYYTGTPDFLAARAQPQLARRPVQDRALLIFQPLGYDIKDHLRQRNLAEYLVRGVRLEPTRNWYREFFTGLKRRDVELGLIITDEESGVVNWAIAGEMEREPGLRRHLFEVFADPDVQKAMPENLRPFTAEQLLNVQRDAVNAWNDWVINIRERALKALICDTYADIFGKLPIVSNYGNARSTFPLFDINGWPIHEQQVSDWSSPECYLGWTGYRQSPQAGRKKQPHWNRFLDCINYIRGCTAYNGKCMPWISFPRFDNQGLATAPVQWLWVQLLRHALQTIADEQGVARIIYWNPKSADAKSSTDADDLAVSNLLTEAAAKELTTRRLGEIAMDEDMVTTGDVTTRYEEFVAAENPAPRLRMPTIQPRPFP